MSRRHFCRFSLASLAGVGVQLALLATLVHGLRMPYLAATAVAVVATIVHNFLWHWRWTWADRHLSPGESAGAFGRFALSNGSVSLAGNLVAMPLLVGRAGLPPVAANVAAIAICGLLNFWLADRIAFRPRESRRRASSSL